MQVVKAAIPANPVTQTVILVMYAKNTLAQYV